MIIYANGVVRATDVDGNTQSIGVVGAQQDELKMSDLNQQDMLTNIIKELKIMNTHLSLMTDVSIGREDVEV